MIRLLILLFVLTLAPMPSLAEDILNYQEDISGVYTWPEGVSEADASYVYRYTYPQFSEENSLALSINQTFQYDASDALGFECPMIASDHPAELGQMQVNISYEITHLSSDALSVRVDKTVTVGETVSSSIKAYTFKLSGSMAGTATSLPFLLELVDVGSSDEWLIDRQIAKAEACVRDMVWALIERDMKKSDSSIYDDLTLEDFEYSFYPEEDFYLDTNGDFVFFIQEDTIAPQEAGHFFYTISMDDLLDEI